MSRRRSFGNVRKQASGRWQVRYKGPDGRTRTGDRTFATKVEATRHLAEIEAELVRGSWSDPRGRSVKLAAYADEWLVHRKLAIRTRELYADLLRLHIKPQIGNMRLGSITPLEVRRWYHERQDNTGATRLRQSYSLLRTILNTAVRDGLLPSNPCQITGAGVDRIAERPYLSREQAEALADAMPAQMRVLVVVTLWAHLRLGELLALRREDFDVKRGTLHIHRQIVRTKSGPIETTTKTKNGRVVHLPSQAREALADHLASRESAARDDWLFTHSSGQPLARHHVGLAWSRARKKTGLDGYHFHDLRHAGLTYVAQKGATTRELMARAGHTSVRAAMIYQHASERRDAELAELLSDRPGLRAQDAGS